MVGVVEAHREAGVVVPPEAVGILAVDLAHEGEAEAVPGVALSRGVVEIVVAVVAVEDLGVEVVVEVVQGEGEGAGAPEAVEDHRGRHLQRVFKSMSILPRNHCLYYHYIPRESSEIKYIKYIVPDRAIPQLSRFQGFDFFRCSFHLL